MTVLFLMTVLPALLVYFLDFTFGRPSDEKPGYSDIFFGYTFSLCVWKLKRLGVWTNLKDQYKAGMKGAKTDLARAEVRKSFKEIVFQTARPHFTWENAVGMCPICFHFWVNLIFTSLLVGQVKNIAFLENNFCLVNNLIIFVMPFLTGHLLIRTLKKFI